MFLLFSNPSNFFPKLRRELVITKSVNENKMKDRSSFFSKLCSAGMQPERGSQSSPKTEENIIVWHCIMKPKEKTDLYKYVSSSFLI